MTREITIYLAGDLSGESGKEPGMLFGGVSGAAITARYNHIAGKIARNKRLRGQIIKLRKRLFNI